MYANGETEKNGREAEERWSLLAEDLRAYREPHRTWGEVDEAKLSRYVAGEATAEERAYAERAMEQYPAVRECVAIVRALIRDAAGDRRAAAEAPDPSTVPFPSLGPVSRIVDHVRRRPAIAAGLILALVCGVATATAIAFRSSHRAGGLQADIAPMKRERERPPVIVADARPDRRIELHTGESAKNATWKQIWDSSYVDTDSPSENLQRIYGAAGAQVKAFIDDMRKMKHSDSAILAELNQKYGQRQE